ncbi:MAG: amidohydrolase family protein [Albimonas sp.]|uniref:amidohydrolase family protein n=1 Tax=Albimonas sp. TaxID=1872425 RepID=UPI0040564200
MTDAPREEILEPDLPIIDPHHHLWRGRASHEQPPVHGFNKVLEMVPDYMFDEMLADMNSGHDVRATVFVDCRAFYRDGGPEGFETLGETEFANGVGALAASGQFGPKRMCAGIVSRVDLTLGDLAGAVLEAHMHRAPDRFRGIRNVGANDEDRAVSGPMHGRAPAGLYLDPTFRKGFAHLQRLGLSFDAWVFEPQLGDVIDLARAFPETSIILDHVGTPVNIGRWAGTLEERRPHWLASIKALAECPNVTVKLGGLAMSFCNLEGFLSEPPASSEVLAKAWAPWIEPVVEAFGADRCMMESNFPVDRGACTYATLWNALKRVASGASDAEKAALFHGTASRVYRVALPAA